MLDDYRFANIVRIIDGKGRYSIIDLGVYIVYLVKYYGSVKTEDYIDKDTYHGDS